MVDQALPTTPLALKRLEHGIRSSDLICEVVDGESIAVERVWLSIAELAAQRGITHQRAKVLTQNRGWLKLEQPNLPSNRRGRTKRGLVVYLVPEEEAEPKYIRDARKPACSVTGCDRKAHCRGMCDLHYRRARTGLRLDDPPKSHQYRQETSCTWPGCERKSNSRSLCSMHYQRQRHGSPMDARPHAHKIPEGAICSVEGCGRKLMALDLCRRHYQRQKLGLPTEPPPRVMVCEVTGCERSLVARGLCRRHWEIWRDTRTIEERASCTIEACDRASVVKGMCQAHYRQVANGKLSQTAIRAKVSKYTEPCCIPSCDRAARNKGMCGAHYARSRLGNDLLEPIKEHERPYTETDVCSVVGCSERPTTRWMCHFHYGRLRDGRDPDLPRRPASTGRVISKDGYADIRVPKGTPGAWKSGWMPEHRYVMQQLLARPLLGIEEPHHINGIRSDNRPDNLELWSKSHPAGQRVVDKVAWAVEMLLLYPTFIGLDLVDLASLRGILERVQRKGEASPTRRRSRKAMEKSQ